MQENKKQDQVSKGVFRVIKFIPTAFLGLVYHKIGKIARRLRKIVGTRVLAVGEDSHALRLVCKHPDLRAANANLAPQRFALRSNGSKR